MHISTRVDQTRILQSDEIQAVIESLDSKTTKNAAINHTLFRLSCCVVLRRCEIHGLNLGDVVTHGPRPHVRVRPETSKANSKGNRKGRKVPLWWDSGTREHLQAWQEWRFQHGGKPSSPFLIGVKAGVDPEGRLAMKAIQKRWKTAIAILGKARVSQLSVHDGRHSFASHSLQAGRSLVEVRDALGHSNVSITSIYLHMLDRNDVPDVFQKRKPK